MKKICTCRSLERDAEKDFRWEYKDRGILMTRCKYCQSELGSPSYPPRQLHIKRAALSHPRFTPDATTVPLNNILTDGKAQSPAILLLGLSIWRTIKCLKNKCLLLF